MLTASMLVALSAAQPTPQFWPAAQAIVNSQANWFDRAEASMVTVDPVTNQILSTKLLVQLRSMDQFVQRYNNNPARLCKPSATGEFSATANMDTEQVESYCAIYKLSRDLTPLRDLMTQRASLFNLDRSGEKTPLFTVQGMPFMPQSIEQVNLVSRIPAKPKAPTMTFLKPVGSQVMKGPQAKVKPYVSPAILPATDILKLINQGRDQLLAIQVNAPLVRDGISDDAKPKTKATPAAKYAVTQSESDIYAEFLKQPNTGIGRIYPGAAFVPDDNRLDPANIPMPFGLRVADGQFVMGGGALDYGFMEDLGDGLRPTGGHRDFKEVDGLISEEFQRYVPPQTVEAIQADQRRFLVGKNVSFSSQIPAMLHRTYVMRVVQYQLPELIASGRALKPGERGQLKYLLQGTVGRDRLVAFRPIVKRNDGSYTVVWQVLKTNAEPTIVDLEKYVSINLKTRSQQY
jgi:hypothetical protein